MCVVFVFIYLSAQCAFNIESEGRAFYFLCHNVFIDDVYCFNVDVCPVSQHQGP
jgi:hypothetical protein